VHSGNHTHAGKLPERIGGGIQLQRQIETLKEELKGLIEQEEFEKAAELRDEIRLLEKQMNEQKEG
jgi:protein arginine kinase activator